jgi:hypothetical protein
MASEALSRPSVGGGAAKRKERTMDGNFTIGRFGRVCPRHVWGIWSHRGAVRTTGDLNGGRGDG